MLNKSWSRGQVTTEYIILVGALLIILAIVASYALTVYYETVRVNQARNVVVTLGNAADSVYSLGPGNSTVVKISMPFGVTETRAQGKEIWITLETAGQQSDYVVATNGPVSGTIPSSEGIHFVRVAVTDANVVLSEV